MSKPPASNTYVTRRERRLATRDQAKAEGRPIRPGKSSRRGPSPIVLMTLLAFAIGVVVIAFVALGGKPAEVAEVTHPAVMTPLAKADGRALGPTAAKVTVEVWADFQCPGCETFTSQVEPAIVNKYVTTDKIRFVFHDMAFLGPESTDAAIAARAADAQGKFWLYHDYLYANQGRRENAGAFSRERLLAIASAVGLDLPKFEAALDDPTLRAAVVAEVKVGQAAGVTSTPTVIVAGQILPGYDVPTVSAAIDAALGSPAEASPAP